MKNIKALILTGYGLNCDYETAYALELAGATAVRVHINALINGKTDLDDFQILVFGGGFSWGDDHGAGVVQAVRMKTNLGNRILQFIDTGNLVLGICNGFQTLVNLGLLPGFDKNYTKRSVALVYNDCGNFRDDWVDLKVNSSSSCIFTAGINRLDLPVRHGEGKFYAGKTIVQKLIDNNQVVLQYATPDGKPANRKFPFNPNGSVHDIAGICDPTGRIFGLMPHPEAYNHFTNHPHWPRTKEYIKRRNTDTKINPVTGICIFDNAIKYIRENLL